MSGFDNGTLQSGVFFQVKQLGSILRGLGPPSPNAGVEGDCYIDTTTFHFYNKRAASGSEIDPWGHWLFVVPAQYQTQLKWFSSSPPQDSLGVVNDYCLLWGGYGNYGISPVSIYGPKQASGWPENGEGPTLPIAVAGALTVLPIGALDEGTPVTDSNFTQLILIGAVDEVVSTTPAPSASAGDPVQQLGAQSGPAQVVVAINPLFTATDEHNV